MIKKHLLLSLTALVMGAGFAHADGNVSHDDPAMNASKVTNETAKDSCAFSQIAIDDRVNLGENNTQAVPLPMTTGGSIH